MNKFKVGQEVECIESNVVINSRYYGGAGWKKGLRFKIISISSSGNGCPIYWPGLHNLGIYEPFLKLVRCPNSGIIIKKYLQK